MSYIIKIIHEESESEFSEKIGEIWFFWQTGQKRSAISQKRISTFRPLLEAFPLAKLSQI